MVWVPYATVVLSHVIEYGADVCSAPTLEPSTLNWTPTTPTLSEAVAVSATAEPETVVLVEGAVRETEGAVVSIAVTFVLHEVLPPPPVTVSVYVVLTVGATLCEPEV
jgi:hypothetical protein